MKKLSTGILICLFAIPLFAHATNDEIQFGNPKSEKRHNLESKRTEYYSGGLGETALRFLPLENVSWEGGTAAFTMKVDSEKQNYFTVRCFGSEIDNNFVLLFIQGKQIGYRHLGDIDYLSMGNGEAPCSGRFYYLTLPLPLSETRGKKEVSLEMRSYGPIWGYGETFDKYQKNMETPTIGFYKGYTHTESYLTPAPEEKQGEVPAVRKREKPGKEVLSHLKERVNNSLSQIMDKELLTSQQEMWFLADAFSVKWTVAYKNRRAVELLEAGIDDYYKRYLQNPTLIYTDGSVYNSEWLLDGPIARVIRMMWNEFEPRLTPERRAAWAKLMEEGLAYSTTHRREYTNQSMIIDLFMYDINIALTLLDSTKALPESQTLRYLHESVGLAPWTGINNARPLGNDYWQLTKKGLTKELGYVGTYGEVIDWVVDIYRSSEDPQIREQLLKIMQGRSYFRYPGIDGEGNAVMRMESVVGWRDGGHYPGDIVYGDRGMGWDATPLMTASMTLDPRALGMAQQMFRDNQFFACVEEKMKENGIRVSKSLLYIPTQYETVLAQPQSNYKMPMATESPDMVFSDEEDGVVAVKNGSEILYASLYWRARFAVNNLAKVHYITPTTEHVANICIETIIDDSGLRYTRPDWVNMGFNGAREWYKGVNSAYAGEILPIARIPEGVNYKVGDENVYAGKALFYRMQYGNYVIGMNSSKDQSFTLSIPKASQVFNLSNNKELIKGESLKVPPMTTVVLYLKF
ncbi:MAG TPA: hypothetical protein VIK42_00380 [Bacteroidales bacterium]